MMPLAHLVTAGLGDVSGQGLWLCSSPAFWLCWAPVTLWSSWGLAVTPTQSLAWGDALGALGLGGSSPSQHSQLLPSSCVKAQGRWPLLLQSQELRETWAVWALASLCLNSHPVAVLLWWCPTGVGRGCPGSDLGGRLLAESGWMPQLSAFPVPADTPLSEPRSRPYSLHGIFFTRTPLFTALWGRIMVGMAVVTAGMGTQSKKWQHKIFFSVPCSELRW